MPLADTVAVQDVMGRVADELGMRPLEGPAELVGLTGGTPARGVGGGARPVGG
jgi:hypothetical protein